MASSAAEGKANDPTVATADELFLDFLAQQSLHPPEESSCSTSHAEATVKQLANAWIRIALHKGRSRGINVMRE